LVIAICVRLGEGAQSHGIGLVARDLVEAVGFDLCEDPDSFVTIGAVGLADEDGQGGLPTRPSNPAGRTPRPLCEVRQHLSRAPELMIEEASLDQVRQFELGVTQRLAAIVRIFDRGGGFG